MLIACIALTLSYFVWKSDLGSFFTKREVIETKIIRISGPPKEDEHKDCFMRMKPETMKVYSDRMTGVWEHVCKEVKKD